MTFGINFSKNILNLHAGLSPLAAATIKRDAIQITEIILFISSSRFNNIYWTDY